MPVRVISHWMASSLRTAVGGARRHRSVLLAEHVEQVLQDRAENRAARAAGEKARQAAGKAHARGNERRELSLAAW